MRRRKSKLWGSGSPASIAGDPLICWALICAVDWEKSPRCELAMGGMTENEHLEFMSYSKLRENRWKDKKMLKFVLFAAWWKK
jgi:hypothetical protein